MPSETDSVQFRSQYTAYTVRCRHNDVVSYILYNNNKPTVIIIFDVPIHFRIPLIRAVYIFFFRFGSIILYIYIYISLESAYVRL
jgi:hypothetical protein